jgi:hypothetical protein
MKTLITTIAFGLLIAVTPVTAQDLAPNPNTAPGQFCDQCVTLGCSCDAEQQQCTDCGLTASTGNREPSAADKLATQNACGKAKGRFSSRAGTCAF